MVGEGDFKAVAYDQSRPGSFLLLDSQGRVHNYEAKGKQERFSCQSHGTLQVKGVRSLEIINEPLAADGAKVKSEYYMETEQGLLITNDLS